MQAAKLKQKTLLIAKLPLMIRAVAKEAALWPEGKE
jgi:hypothetical protein